MKRYITILFILYFFALLTSGLYAQNKKPKTSDKGIYSNLTESEKKDAKTTHDALEKNINRLSNPDEFWDSVYSENIKKPAVILSRQVLYTPAKYTLNPEENVVTVYSHQRIKIMDKLGADIFRIIYTPTSSSFEVLVGKSGNQMKVVSKSTLVKELSSSDVPYFYQQFHWPYTEYQKLAMPGLEPGDIIELKVAYSLPFPIKYVGPQLIWLQDIYPIQKQRYVFEGIGVFNFHFKSFNNAPSPFKSKLENKFNAFTLEADSAPARHSEYFGDWFYNLPGFKFYYSSELAIKERINKEITTKEITTLYDKAPNELNSLNLALTKEVINYLEKNFKKASKDVKAKEAYYFLRTVTVVRFQTNGLKYMPSTFLRTQDGVLTDVGCRFYNEILKGVFDYFKIPYNYTFGMPRQSGQVKYALNAEEMAIGLQVNTEKPFFIFPAEANALPNEVPPSLEGTNVLIHNPKSSAKDHLDSIAISIPDSNSVRINYTLTMDPGFEKLHVKEKLDANGYLRFRFLNYLEIKKEFVESDYDRIHLKISKSKRKHKNNSRLITEAYEKDLTAADKEKLRIEQVESELDDNGLLCDKVHSVKLLSAGRYHTDPHVKAEMEYTLMQLVSKAGNNYVVALGKLIGSQMEITGEDTVREFKITQKYLRQFHYTLSFEIPAGYTVEDLSSFQSQVVNESCSVSSKASIANNVLTIDIERRFTKQEDPASAWNNYLVVIDEAYRLSQGKILLKKK